MSRDLRPIEMYSMSKSLNETEDVIAVANSLKFGYKDDPFPVYSEEQQALHYKYPYLTMTEIGEVDLWWRRGNLEPVEYLDRCIREMVENNNIIDQTVEKWFAGELDTGFYYREWNTKLLNDYLEEKFSCEKK